MAVDSSTSLVTYAGNDSTSTGYPVTFSFLDSSHVGVQIETPDGELLTLDTTEFTVITGVNQRVTTATSYDAEHTVTLYRLVPLTQPTQYPEGGTFPAASHERALDRLTHISQQIARDVGRSLRVGSQATVAGDLTLEAGTVFGVDANGDVANLTAADVREMALLDGGESGMPQATFANAAGRAATTPSFAGQLGIQRDDYSLWAASATAPGAWAPASLQRGPMTVVSTFAELVAALLVGGDILIKANTTIELPSTLTVGVAGTRISGMGGSVLDLVAETSDTAISLDAPWVSIRNLRLTSSTQELNGAVQHYGIAGATNRTESHLWVDGCEIDNFTVLISTGGGGSGMARIRDMRITNNHLHTFDQSAVAYNWNVDDILVAGNIIDGRPTGATHDVDGDEAIAIANNCLRIRIINNTIRNHLSSGGPSTVKIAVEIFDECHDALVQGNSFENCSWFGLSIFRSNRFRVVGNSFSGVKDAAIEIVGTDSTVRRQGVVSGNVIDGVTAIVTYSFGIWLNRVRDVVISANTISGLVAQGTRWHNAGIACGDSMDILVHGNHICSPGGVGIAVSYEFEGGFCLLHDNSIRFEAGDAATVYGFDVYGGDSGVDKAVIRNNTVLYPTAKTCTLRAEQITVYTGETSTVVAGAATAFSGGNLKIAY